MKLLIKLFIMLTIVSCFTNKSIGTIYKVIDSELESLVRTGNVEGLEYKLSKMTDVKIEVNETDKDGWTPLWIASKDGHKEVVELLLKAGADIEKSSKNGATPLWIASQQGKVEVVELLLKAGADLDKAARGGYTPLLVASHNGHKEVVEALLKGGANKEKAQKDGATLLFIASQLGQVAVVDLLLKAGADKEKAQKDGETPLYIASQEVKVEVVELLLSYGTAVTEECLKEAKTEKIKQLLRNSLKQIKWPTSKKKDIEEKESKPKKVIKQEDSSGYGIDLQEREDVIKVNKGKEEKPTTNKNIRLRREEKI